MNSPRDPLAGSATVSVGAGDPEIEGFHHLNPELQDDPYPLYAKIREECPIARSERFGGFWIFSTYEDVRRAFSDPDLFSSFPGAIPAMGLGQQRPVIPGEIDPPDHGHYRHILNPLFTAQRLEPLEPRIRQMARGLVDSVQGRGHCEYVSEFAEPFTSAVFLDLVGLPLSDAPMLVEWADRLQRGVPGDDEATASLRMETGMNLYGYFAQELVQRDDAGSPATGLEADFIDTLRSATFAGVRPLNHLEILDCLFIVMLAGLDTTQGVLSFATEFLATHDDHRRELATRPDVMGTAIEELVRFFAPIASARRVKRDVTMRGIAMKADDQVMLLGGSACRDSTEFPDPEMVDFRRSPNRHLGFGGGPHRCLGIHLARMELRIAFEEWHKAIPDYRLVPGMPSRSRLSAVRRMDELHVEWP